ncbi:MAG: MFS transporter, partial [Yoonia sp.]|uniref:MFS transporter n=1 Tax=Yoonia sp. TaxID=2212373 RepID=UPI003EF54CA5
TSLPAIAADLQTSPVALKLALTSYLVSLAMFIPLSGWIADRYGATRTFKWAIVVFVIGSLACAMADSLGAFVLWRFVQGIGGSMMSPVARLILVRKTPRDQLVTAMAWLTIPAMLGPLIGPPLGGLITTFASWHWIFVINAPIGVIGLYFVNRFLEPTGYRDYRPLDVVGLGLISVCFAGTVFGVSVVSHQAIPVLYGTVAICAGLVSGLFYIIWAGRTARPLLRIDLFRNASFRASIIGGSVFRLGLGASAFLLPLMLQLAFGMSPWDSGRTVFVGAIGVIAVKVSIAPLLNLMGYKYLLIIGSITTGLTFMSHSMFDETTPIFVIMLVLLGSGFFRSTFMTANGTVAYVDLNKADIADATTFLASFQQLSLAFGVAIAGVILETSATQRGGDIGLPDFHLTFAILGATAMLACLFYLKIDKRVGRKETVVPSSVAD